MSRFRAGWVTALTAIAAFGGTAQAALPVIPGAAGFGMETPAGRGGKIYRVTSLAASGAGTLHECATASGPRVCVFEVSGIIWLTQELSIKNPYLTIAGQTAPSPGITILGAGLGIHASDVLVQHISVRPGDKSDGPAPNIRDALAITSPYTTIERVVVANCSFGWSIDEMMSIQGLWNNVTLYRNLFAEPLHDSLHPDGPHGFGSLSGPTSSGRASFVGNLFSSAIARNAMTRSREFVFVNNVAYNYQEGTDLQSEGVATLNSVVGNYYIKGPSSNSNPYSVRAHGDSRTLVSGSKIYLSGNVGNTPGGTPVTSDPWSILDNESGLSRLELEAKSPPTWPSGLVARMPANEDVLGWVLDTAGAHPANRSNVDARIISEVRNRTGKIINCVAPDGSTRCAANAGGWPSYPETRRALTLPANPNSDDDADGYTNLEEWLHTMAAAVEGSETSRPNPPVVSVF